MQRKIQLIAGSTYTVSLPKEWVKKNNLKEKNEVMLTEKDDGSLTISPGRQEQNITSSVKIDITEYKNQVDTLLYVLYYSGIEKIELTSKDELTKETKSKIRVSLRDMSGTEISYEDNNKIIIEVLLDKTKINVINTIYRIGLIIGYSVDALIEGEDLREIEINETEVDRLYTLITKIITLSLKNMDILQSSGIKKINLVPSFLLISKKLETLADSIEYLSAYINKKRKLTKEEESIFLFIKERLLACVTHLLKHDTAPYSGPDKTILKKTVRTALQIDDKTVSIHVEDALRYLKDIEEEIKSITYYYVFTNEIARQNKITEE